MKFALNLHRGCKAATDALLQRAAAILPELYKKLDPSYPLKGAAAVLDLARFQAPIVPNRFT